MEISSKMEEMNENKALYEAFEANQRGLEPTLMWCRSCLYSVSPRVGGWGEKNKCRTYA
jgi:hypothetical protein